MTLGENEIKTLDDLADLASDELIELLGDLAPSHEEADAIIMAARAHWFEDEETPESGEDEVLTAGAEPEGSVQADEAKEA
jgi:N utilization substance protein A